jgi:energy-coupling factor transport system substrate-specific component
MRSAALAAAALAAGALATAVLRPHAVALPTLLAALAVLVAGLAWLESGRDHAKELAVVATLGSVAAAGHVVLHPVPGVQPVTLITVATGAALGARAGVGVGTAAPFVSNFALGQGPWTVWQMLAWGACGALGAACAPLLRRRLVFAALLGVVGLAFSAGMDVWSWAAYYEQHTWATFVANEARGFPFDVSHAVGNVVFALVAGPELLRLLERFGRRLHAEVVWA